VRLTTKSEYALLMLTYLARRGRRGPVPLAEVARDQDIPLKYLEHLAAVLSGAGYLRAQRGPRGGYRLARDAGAITLAEIVRLLDGPLAPARAVSKHYYEPSPLEKERKVMRILREIRTFVAGRLESTTLADVS
jgi:Rrf2 family cysteine metabolism transcriptional repressor